MKVLKKIVFFLLIAFVGIQFMPTNRNQSKKVLATDFAKIFNVPNNVQNLLKNSCYDCHSNNTKYPWYNNIQPIGWLLEKHVKEGKSELNFSEFGTYSKRRQKSKLKSAVSQIEAHKMPISSYALIHKNANLSESDRKLLTAWLAQLKFSLQ